MANLRFCSLNCRGLGDLQKRDLLLQCLQYNKVDICFLQETHCYSLKCAKTFNRHFGGKLFWSFGTNRSKGVGIWVRPGLNFEMMSMERDSEGRLIYLVVKINNKKLKLVNVYAPVIPRERKVFFKSLNRYLQGNCPTILGGDFNCVIDVNIDKCGGSDLYGELGSENLINVCENHRLFDAFRNLYPDKKEYSWQNSLNTISCRLDRFYLSESLLNNVCSVMHEPVNKSISDHYIVKMNMCLGDTETGPGYWKCNSKILKDVHFQEDFRILWECLDSVSDQNAEWWEDCKMHFRNLIMSHSMRISFVHHEEFKEAKRDLMHLIRLNERDGGTCVEMKNKSNRRKVWLII